jgi:drug/metabolite transporter (DMT)-like permease
MIVAFIAVGEPITGKKVFGVLLSLAGIIFLILNSTHAANGVSSTSPLGYVLLLLNGIFFSCYLGIFRPLIRKYSVISFMKWSFLFSLIVSLPFSAKGLITADYADMTAKIWLEIGFLVIFATCIAYFLIPYGQKTVRPTVVSMYNYLQPIIAAIFSIMSGYDTITAGKVAAIILVFTGVAVVNRSRAAAA